jgi:hypothetical protein
VKDLSGLYTEFTERAMGIEQVRTNQIKALPRASQFNWSQMASNAFVGNGHR